MKLLSYNHNCLCYGCVTMNKTPHTQCLYHELQIDSTTTLTRKKQLL